MRKSTFAVVLSILSISVSGCVADPFVTSSAADATPETIPDDWYLAALAGDAGHDHADLEQHLDASTSNFRLMGHATFETYSAGGLVSDLACGDSAATPEGRRLTVANALDREALIVFDVTDPGSPFEVGEFTAEGLGGYDAAITADGRFAVVAMAALARTPSTPTLPARASMTWRSACGDVVALPDLAATSGVLLLDLAHPETPTYVDHWPLPALNLHSITVTNVDGRDIIAASAVNLVTGANYWAFLTIVATPLTPKLALLSAFAQPPATVQRDASILVHGLVGHVEADVEKHPLDGRTYAYLTSMEGGLSIVDITVPAAPILVSMWAPNLPPGPGVSSSSAGVAAGIFGSLGCFRFGLHAVLPIPGLRDGRHYVLAQQECPRADDPGIPAGEIFVLDVTDPADPQQVGRWNLPVDTAPWTVEYQASPHYLAIVGDTLFVTMYHAGLWAVDLGGDLVSPPSIGVYLPDRPPAVHSDVALAPKSAQVNAFPNGDLVLYEARSGLYTLRFNPEDAAPPALPHFRDQP